MERSTSTPPSSSPPTVPPLRTGLSRPVAFVPSSDNTRSLSLPPPSTSSGDDIANLYRSIVSSASSPSSEPATSIPIAEDSNASSSSTTFCAECNKQIPESTMKEHIQTVAHMVSAEYMRSVDFLTLNQSNVGFRMMQTQGWQYEEGLGALGEGRRHPVATVLKKDRSGIGHKHEPKRVTHLSRDIEQNFKKELPQPPSGKQLARKARRESKKRVAMLKYMNE
ncbi:predicted protein [Lichtheimia corymbifera JMRC:FSU:9682]|uniref:G-patch domain-containing protein n=1 Tax=Lichtheimia corymbifera JMRC:FSU:9682 TaxID=1263082 RepID=A0A068RZ79_9FUNG|nr:predicted protein [Lichtheimia corymbifera JMRC:FSU:9682]